MSYGVTVANQVRYFLRYSLNDVKDALGIDQQDLDGICVKARDSVGGFPKFTKNQK